MIKFNLNEISKKELININGGMNPISFNVSNFFNELEEARRKSAELRSIR